MAWAGSSLAPSSLAASEPFRISRQGRAVCSSANTSCQDVCPATLAHLQSLVRDLGKAAGDVQVLFVTVDPENDTADHLKQYLARFDSRFVGLTGKREEVDQIASLFMVKHDRSHGVEVSNEYNRGETFTDHSYLYAHSQQIYLLDKLADASAVLHGVTAGRNAGGRD